MQRRNSKSAGTGDLRTLSILPVKLPIMQAAMTTPAVRCAPAVGRCTLPSRCVAKVGAGRGLDCLHWGPRDTPECCTGREQARRPALPPLPPLQASLVQRSSAVPAALLQRSRVSIVKPARHSLRVCAEAGAVDPLER